MSSFKRHPLFFVLNIAAVIAEIAACVVIPLLFKRLVDLGIIAKNGGVCFSLGVLILLITLFALAVKLSAAYLTALEGAEIAAGLRKRAYEGTVFSPNAQDKEACFKAAAAVEIFSALLPPSLLYRPKKGSGADIIITAVFLVLLTFIIFTGGTIIYGGTVNGLISGVTTGGIISAVMYALLIMNAFFSLKAYIPQFARTYKELRDAYAAVDVTAYALDGDNSKAALVRRGDIAVSGVSFYYPNTDKPALNGISLTIKAGEHFAVIGEEGAGKTTLVNLIYRQSDAQDGVITVNGIPVSDYKIADLRAKIGIISQDAYGSIFAASLFKNILISRPDAQERDVYKAAEAAQITLPLTDAAEQGGVNLTEEQRDRLLIARALLKNPEIIIIDDINLSPDGHYGITVIKTSRTAQGITAADRIAVLEDGVITAIGTHSELTVNSALYRELAKMPKMPKKSGHKP